MLFNRELHYIVFAAIYIYINLCICIYTVYVIERVIHTSDAVITKKSLKKKKERK